MVSFRFNDFTVLDYMTKGNTQFKEGIKLDQNFHKVISANIAGAQTSSRINKFRRKREQGMKEKIVWFLGIRQRVGLLNSYFALRRVSSNCASQQPAL